MSPIDWAVIVPAGVVAAGWLAIAARLGLLYGRERPLKAAEEPVGPDAPAIDAIVAARDEERDVEASLASLLAQDYPRLTITVVDDQSTDATGPILDRMAATPRPPGSPTLRVIHGVARPPGWVGKTWAVRQGAEHATADWLVFIDADMRLHPRALSTAWIEAGRHRVDLVSLFPGGRPETFWQSAVALALAQILSHLYPLRRVNDPCRPEALAAGGFFLVRRSIYEKAGGHEAVRAEIVEDVQLAGRIKRAGGRLWVKGAPDLAQTHMYGTFAEIWRGLRKNAYAGMEYRFHKYAFGALFGLVMAWAPIAALALGLLRIGQGSPGGEWLAGVGAAGWLAQALATFPFTTVLGLSPLASFILPAGISLYVAIATSSVWNHHRGRILWKGVTYDPTALRPADRPGPGRADGAPGGPAGGAPAGAGTVAEASAGPRAS